MKLISTIVNRMKEFRDNQEANGVISGVNVLVVSVLLLIIGFFLAATFWTALGDSLTGPFNITDELTTYIPLAVTIIFGTIMISVGAIALYYVYMMTGQSGKQRQ
jgi:hypothetical protein